MLTTPNYQSAIVTLLNKDVTTPEMISAARREHKALLCLETVMLRIANGVALYPISEASAALDYLNSTRQDLIAQ